MYIKEQTIKKVFLIFTIIFGLTLLINIFLIFYEALFSENIPKNICFREECFKKFHSLFETKLSFVMNLFKFYFASIAILGVYLAYAKFLLLANDSNIHNHIRNFEFFYNIVKQYIDKNRSIVINQVEITYLYRKVFPNSTTGNLQLTGEFLKDHQALRNYLINFSKGKSRKKPINSKDSFIQHRNNIINFGNRFGITLPSSPQSDFYVIEDNFFEFLDYLAITFLDTKDIKLLKKINLHYR